MLGALNLLPSAGGYGAQLWGLPVPPGELQLVGMVLRGDFERVMHLPDSATSPSGAEYGLKLGSQLFIKHIVESGLAAKGNSLQEGDLILKVWGPQGVEHSRGGLICPFLEGLSLAGVTAGPSHGCAGGSSVCVHSLLQPLWLSQGPCRDSLCPDLCCQDWRHVLLAHWGCVHPTVPTMCGPPLCVCVPTG